MSCSCNVYNNVPEGPADVEGMVYKVKEGNYGTQLYLRKGIFDQKRYIVYSKEYYPPGTLLRITGYYESFNKPSNEGEFNSRLYYFSQNIICRIKAENIDIVCEKYNKTYYYMSLLADRLKYVYKNVCNEKYASVFNAVIIGKKDELDEEINGLFTSFGIGHILAISGLHISMIGMAVYKLIRKTGAGCITSMLTSSILIILYGIMTGNGISTVRALIMFIVYVYSFVAGRTYDMISAASLSAVVSLVFSPMLIFNCGFLLSYMAVAGIVYVYHALKKIFPKENKITDGFLVSISIQAATLPVTLYFYFQIPVLSAMLNIIVIPLMTFVMTFAISGGIAGIFFLPAGKFLIAPAVYIIKLFESLCSFNSKIRWAIYTPGRPDAIKTAVYYLIVILFVILCERYGKKLYLAILSAAVMILMIKIYPYFKITFADVGQGECIFIRSGNVTYLVDAGSSDNRNVYEYVIRPCLLSNGCDSLDYLIITHCDSDHISAVTELYDDGIIEVKNILMPDTSMIDEEYEKIINIAEKNGTKIIKASKGMEICSGNLYIKCIHPPAGYSTSEKNNYSTVLYLKYKTFSALLTGDIPDDVEKSVVQSAIEMEISGGITILKAAHHGSRNSNSEDLISYFNPEIAVISCGKDNSYGHPHKEATERFNRFGCKILRTDLDGAISVYVINSIIRINT